jgi:hypothetical protein
MRLLSLFPAESRCFFSIVVGTGRSDLYFVEVDMVFDCV